MALLLVIPLSNLFARFITKSGFYIVGAVMMLLSTSCLSSAILLDAPQLSLIVAIGDIAGAVAFGFYFLLWFSQCQWFQPMFVLGSFVAASFIAALPSSFCSSLTLNGVLIAGCIFGVMAVGLLYAGLRLLCNANHMKNLPKAESKEQSFPGMLWRIVVLMAAQRLVFAFNEGSLAVAVFGTGSNSSVGYLVVILAIALYIMLSWTRMTLIILARYTTPILGIAFLVIPRDSLALMTISNMLASGFCAAVDTTVVLLLAMLCHCANSSHEWLKKFGLVYGIGYLCVAAGESLSLLSMFLGVHEIIFGAMAVMAAIALFVMLPDSSMVSSWFSVLQIFDVSEKAYGEEGSNKLTPVRDYHVLARQYGLTLREEEVLELIASGKTSMEISEQLVVSHETVRTHRRHIYAKFDVRGEDDLKKLLS